MAYTKRLIDLRSNYGIQQISGVCSNSSAFASQINTVTERLMERGSWWGTETLLKICFTGCRIVWPKQVGTVIGLRSCRGGSVPIHNSTWAVFGYMPGGCCGGDTFRGNAVMYDDGTSAVQQEITGNEGKYIRLHIVKATDVGKTVKLFGFQYGNQPLQELDSDGNWQMGVTLTAALADVQTTMLVTKLTDIVFDSTQGRKWLYQVHPTSGDLMNVGMYEPEEVSPAYRVSRIQNVASMGGYTDDNDRCIRQAEALVKLEFVPAMEDNDFVMLDNLAAVELGIAALRAERANDDVLAETKWAKAIRELNMQIRNKNPSLQTTIRTNDLSSCGVFYSPI